MSTRPMPLYPDGSRYTPTGVVARIEHALRFAKYGVAGAIGGIAIAHTLEQLGLVEATQSVDVVSGLVGAVCLVILGKLVRNL